MIPFTYREFKKAWENLTQAFIQTIDKTNAHRLLLFYAVETGLKAVILKRENKTNSESGTQLHEFKHDLNKLIDYLKMGKKFKIEGNIKITNITLNYQEKERIAKIGDLNQIWRYGSSAQTPNDEELEKKLCTINEWIKQELK